MIERTPTEVSNRSSDDETQPKPKDTKNNEKKGTYIIYLTLYRSRTGRCLHLGKAQLIVNI